MPKYANVRLKINFITSFIALSVIYGCASMQQPSGGPKDTQPPKVEKESPKNLTKRFAVKKIEIEFDEFIKLSNEFTEVSISPALDEMPIFKARKQLLEIKFDKPLEENTTYTINFGKAIVDVNESNILKNYTYVFSTGDQIDSLSISGNVKSSVTKEALKDATVFILPVKQDTIFGKKRANIFTSTDSAGNFILQNLREDDYLVYALKEESADRIYNSPAEEIGFLQDTLHLDKNISGLDLRVFKQLPITFSVKDRKIDPDGRIVLSFNKPLSNASVKIVSPPALNSQQSFEITSGRDSALLWLPELTFDSLKVVVSGDKKPLDTVQITRSKRDTYNRAVTITDNLPSAKLRPGTDLTLLLSAPGASFDQTKFTLLEDSASVTGLQVLKDTSARKYRLKYPWKTDREYILNIEANGFTDIFGNKSKKYSKALSLDSEESYGTIALAVTIPDTAKTYLVQWLNQEKSVLRTDIVKKDTVLNYVRYPTAKYHIRVVYDDNKNGIWDTGSIKERRQPERTWNFDKEFTLRPNWDLEEKIVIPKDQ